MEIRCPQCEYTRRVDDSALDPNLSMAVCPRCGHRFSFRRPEKPAESSAADTTPPVNTENRSTPGSPEERPRTGLSPVPGADTDRSKDRFSGSPSRKQPAEPWAFWREAGILSAFVENTRQLFLAPRRFFDTMYTDRGVTPQDGEVPPSSPTPLTVPLTVPIVYALICSVLGVLFELTLSSLDGSTMPDMLPSADGSAHNMALILLFSPVAVILSLYVMSMALHLLLALTGAARWDSLRTTLRVVCYSSATDLLGIIPVFGSLIGGFLRLWLLLVGLSTAHRVPIRRIAPAVAILVLLLMIALVYILTNLGAMA